MFDSLSPTSRGFRMPAEWDDHAGCLMAWPSRTDLWGDRVADAKRDYASIASTIADFEPVVMVCAPGHSSEVRAQCASGVRPVELPINDSWLRDNGPTFVVSSDPACESEIAVVEFGFNAWGNRWHPYDDDARLPRRIAEALGLRFFEALFVLEGGSFFVDGEGTVITTEQCLLNPNRNPHLSREQIEQGLKDFLGATTVVWLPFGHSLDTGPSGTDGHIDGVLQYVAPGRVLLEVVTDPKSPEFARGQANLAQLRASVDATGRPFEVTMLDPGPQATVSYANHYLANGAVIVPTDGGRADVVALETLAMLHPDRQVVGVPGEAVAYGGGGPHCITQQIPHGVVLPW
jgi:agmatine deiminase